MCTTSGHPTADHHPGSTNLAFPTVVCQVASHVHRSSQATPAAPGPAGAAAGARETSPPSQETPSDGISYLRDTLKSAGISGTAASLILAAWRKTTTKQYCTYWQRWFKFCSQRKMSPLQASVQEVIQFLSVLFEQGLSYSSINTAKSAVFALVSTCTDASVLTSSVLIQRFMKGVYNSRPSLPKENFTWDVEKLLRYLSSLSPPKALDLHTLSCKLATLIVLLSGQRGQSVHLLKLPDIEHNASQLILRFTVLLKHSRPGTHLDEIVLPAYTEPRLCVVTTYKEYVSRTKPLRPQSQQKLFITTIKPFRGISRDTLSRWIKLMLRRAGINMAIFNTHSVRAASTSAAYAANVPLQTILKTAGWTGASTFRRFYNKPIRRESTFADSLLHKV